VGTLRQAQERFQTGGAFDPHKALIGTMISAAILEAQALPH
jgi:hypothetical protein